MSEEKGLATTGERTPFASLPAEVQAIIGDSQMDFLSADSKDDGKTVNVYVRSRGADLARAFLVDGQYNGYSCVESIIDDCLKASKLLWQVWPGHFADDRTRRADWIARAAILAMAHRLKQTVEGRKALFLLKTMYRCGNQWAYPTVLNSSLMHWLAAGLWACEYEDTDPLQVKQQGFEVARSKDDEEAVLTCYSTPRGRVAVATKSEAIRFAVVRCKGEDNYNDQEAEEAVRIDGPASFITPMDAQYEVFCDSPACYQKALRVELFLCFPLPAKE